MLGHYVGYKSNLYLVTQVDGDLVKIISPNKKTIKVLSNNVEWTNKRPAKVVTLKGKPFLVTAKINIISLTTSKVVYKNDTAERRAILALL